MVINGTNLRESDMIIQTHFYRNLLFSIPLNVGGNRILILRPGDAEEVSMDAKSFLRVIYKNNYCRSINIRDKCVKIDEEGKDGVEGEGKVVVEIEGQGWS